MRAHAHLSATLARLNYEANLKKRLGKHEVHEKCATIQAVQGAERGKDMQKSARQQLRMAAGFELSLSGSRFFKTQAASSITVIWTAGPSPRRDSRAVDETLND